MKNIVDTTFELIEEKGSVSIADIRLSLDEGLFKGLDISEIDTLIFGDLLNDGRFIYVEGRWDLKVNFTIKEITKEQFKALGNITIEDAQLDEELLLDEDDDPLVIIETDNDDDRVVEYNAIDNLDELTIYEQVEDEN